MSQYQREPGNLSCDLALDGQSDQDQSCTTALLSDHGGRQLSHRNTSSWERGPRTLPVYPQTLILGYPRARPWWLELLKTALTDRNSGMYGHRSITALKEIKNALSRATQESWRPRMQMQASLLLSSRGYMGFCSQRRKKATNQCILKEIVLGLHTSVLPSCVYVHHMCI